MAIAGSKEYQGFRKNVALQRITLDHGENQKVWKFYDFGSKKVKSPLICIPSASGSAECYFRQVYDLGIAGYRVIAAEYPEYWTHESWCEGFTKFIDYLHLDKVHLFGAGLGGFLAQKYAQVQGKRVESLFLCNTFVDTTYFHNDEPFLGYTQWIPEFALKKMIKKNFPQGNLAPSVAASAEFMLTQLEKLDQSQLSSRLKLNTMKGSLEPNILPGKERVTIVDVMDDPSRDQKIRDQVYKFHPEAKIALLKTGGTFCYLSECDEVNMHLKVHLRPYNGTKSSALGEQAHQEQQA